MDTEKIAEAMVIEDERQGQPAVTAQELTENMTVEFPAESPKEESKAAEQSPEEVRKAAIREGINSLKEEGVTSEELLAFSNDEAARKDVQAGKDVVRAFMAYTRRQASAVKGAPEAAQKKSVPTVKSQSTAEPAARGGIKGMSSKEFAELSKRAREAAMMGRKVTFK